MPDRDPNRLFPLPENAKVSLEFEGRELKASQGDTIASALAAAGLWTHEQSHDGEAQTYFCGMGACHQCVVVVAGRGKVRACLTPVEVGMKVECTNR